MKIAVHQLPMLPADSLLCSLLRRIQELWYNIGKEMVRMKRVLMTVLAATGVVGLFAAEQPTLCGDGVHDDTAAPRAWRNTGNKENDKMEAKAFVWNKIDECDQYQGMHPLFKKAFEFLKRPDLATLKVGRYEIEKDNCWAMVQDCELTPFGDIQRPEVHRDFIDIQAPIDGPETYGLADTKGVLYQPFDEAKDIGFADAKTEPLTVQPGEFAIFFPVTGGHAPCKTLGPKTVRRKLVIKVRK